MGYFRANVDKMIGYTPGFQPGAADVVKLNTNENPYPPSPEVLKALGGVSAERLGRYPSPLSDDFRRVAAEVLGVGSENIICTNGGDDLLTIVIRSFCDENRPLAYPSPTYSLYPVLAGLQNCETLEIPFDSEFNLPARLASVDAGLTIVCNPNAPSGTVAAIEELAELAEEIKGVLLIDEAYVDFAEQNCLELVRNFDNVIILRSMSKGYSLAGVRFGFGIAGEKLIEGLRKVKDSYNVDVLAEAAATAAMADQAYFKSNVAKVKAERKRLSDELGNLGFFVYPSQANFVFVKNVSSDIEAAQIYEKLKDENIYVRYWPYAGIADKLRITVGTADQNDRLIEAIKKILAG